MAPYPQGSLLKGCHHNRIFFPRRLPSYRVPFSTDPLLYRAPPSYRAPFSTAPPSLEASFSTGLPSLQDSLPTVLPSLQKPHFATGFSGLPSNRVSFSTETPLRNRILRAPFKQGFLLYRNPTLQQDSLIPGLPSYGVALPIGTPLGNRILFSTVFHSHRVSFSTETPSHMDSLLYRAPFSKGYLSLQGARVILTR